MGADSRGAASTAATARFVETSSIARATARPGSNPTRRYRDDEPGGRTRVRRTRVRRTRDARHGLGRCPGQPSARPVVTPGHHVGAESSVAGQAVRPLGRSGTLLDGAGSARARRLRSDGRCRCVRPQRRTTTSSRFEAARHGADDPPARLGQPESAASGRIACKAHGARCLRSSPRLVGKSTARLSGRTSRCSNSSHALIDTGGEDPLSRSPATEGGLSERFPSVADRERGGDPPRSTGALCFSWPR